MAKSLFKLAAANPFYNRNGKAVEKYFSYSTQVQSDLIAEQQENKLNIGMIVNWGLRRILTDFDESRKSMIADAQEQLACPGVSRRDKKRLEEAIADLETAEKHLEAAIMNNLEKEIDAFAKGDKTGTTSNLYEHIFKDNNVAKHFPLCFDKFGGFNDEGRIPRYLRGDKKPVLLRTELCRTLEEVVALAERLEDAVILMRYEQMRPLPLSLVTRPTNPLAAKVAARQDKAWRRAWRSLNEDNGATSEDRGALYKRLASEFGAKLLAWPLWFQFDVICELAKLIYPGYIGLDRIPVYPDWLDDEETKPHPKAGRPMPHTDGLLWTPVYGKVFVDLLVSEGEANKYVPISLYQDYRGLRKERSLPMKVENGVVFRKDDNAIIGTCLKLADGEYTMQMGFVFEPRLAAPVLASDEDAPADVLAEDERDRAAAGEEGTYEPDAHPKYRVEEVLARYGFRCDFERNSQRNWTHSEKGRFLNGDGDDAYFGVYRGEALYANTMEDDPVGFHDSEELAKFIESTFSLKPLAKDVKSKAFKAVAAKEAVEQFLI